MTTHSEGNQELVNGRFLLEKFPGKGGWTYALIPMISQDKRTPFGWLTVKGTIDDYSFSNFKLMPLKGGKLFFSVKAEIRKKIKKEEGDWVQIILYPDSEESNVDEEFMSCLLEDEKAHNQYKTLSEGERKAILEWIKESKTDKIKVERIAKALDDLSGFTYKHPS